MSPIELETYLHDHIPLSSAMQVAVVRVHPDTVVLSAPLAPNINHRDTVFGGSASAVAILAAWSLLHTRLTAEGIGSRLVIQRNTTSYERPIDGAFTAEATIASPQGWAAFRRTLTRRGKARITVDGVLHADGQVAGRFEGEFVALGAAAIPSERPPRAAEADASPALYDASVPVFLRYLGRLTGLVDAAESYAQARGQSVADLLAARLAPDMLPFERQVVIATNFSLRASFPLAGAQVPSYGEFPETVDGLRARAERAASLLRALQPAQFARAEDRLLESQAGEALVRLPAAEFLFQYALPNFFFHVSMAYAILRSRGVPLGKADFDGFHTYPKKA